MVFAYYYRCNIYISYFVKKIIFGKEVYLYKAESLQVCPDLRMDIYEEAF